MNEEISNQQNLASNEALQENQQVPNEVLQNEAQELPQNQQVPQYSIDPQMLSNLNSGITGLNEQIQSLGANVASLKEAPVKSEEEKIADYFAKQMGLEDIKNQNLALKEELSKMTQAQNAMQAMLQEQQIEAIQNEILTRNNVSREQMKSAFDSLAKEYGKEFALSLNNVKGWEFIIKNHLAPNANQNPDPILTSTNAKIDSDSSFNQKYKQGTLSDDDINNFLLSNLK